MQEKGTMGENSKKSKQLKGYSTLSFPFVEANGQELSPYPSSSYFSLAIT